jgi:hypothetical protein
LSAEGFHGDHFDLAFQQQKSKISPTHEDRRSSYGKNRNNLFILLTSESSVRSIAFYSTM